ncbi:nucleotidyltransferase family protein [Frigoribacterium sp. SL97]|uniref:nucleotidyltransferase family protein n=1 Tax=Frigoribacterium sp. SL97 TaxID=2994664 RepID=UPI00226F1953|nr:nucleotidyltransferase domain-containing protein [Frigoribacterium sp. SL97]WAC51349.1 nucleotidyltransferase domain-containing protein [Frigoribacterium sp. SL97]
MPWGRTAAPRSSSCRGAVSSRCPSVLRLVERAFRCWTRITSRAGLVRRLAGLSHIDAVSVFGSVARGTETDDSDIDLLVDPGAEATYFDFAQFEIDMEAVFQRPVDVVSRRGLDPEADREILTQAVPV